ncbi:YSIRK-type signal peptide-containing protein, partial [Streptococcus sp.]
MKQFKMNEHQRFSIRKFSIGAASVLLGSVFFVANPATEVQAAETSTEVVTPDRDVKPDNSSALSSSETSNQNLNVEQEGAKANTQETEKKEPGTPSKDDEGKAKSTVENTGEEKVDSGAKPVSGELSTVSEVEKDKKEVQPELEEKSSIIKEEANREDKIDQSQEEDGYQLYDKLIDASKRLKESNPESAADFKNLADTINEKLGLSDDGKISGELVEKAHKLLDGNQIDKAEKEGTNNFRRRKRDTELTDVQIGRWNGTRKQFDSSTLFVNPGGLGLAGNNMQIKAISNSDPITDISVTGDDGLGLKKTKGGLNTKEATLSFTGNTPNKGSWILRVTVTTAKGTKTATFGYATPTPTPTITTSADKLNGKSEDKPEVDVTLNETPNLTLPEGIKMKVYLIRGGGDSRDYGGAANGAYPYDYNILATAEVKSDGTAKITSNDYVVSKI